MCTATAQKAVLNTSDLQNMLASGDVAVETGSIAKDIDIDQPLTWATTSRLTLDAQQSVTIKKQVTVSGTGNLTIVTNDGGGKKGEFIIVPEHGSVQFWDLTSSLIIDGNTYTLASDIKTLASDIAANPSGFYALAKPYDALGDGTYPTSAIPGKFLGVFEGLGNTISNFAMTPNSNGTFTFGFFEETASQSVVRHFGLNDVNIDGASGAIVGPLAGSSGGLIDRCWTTGKFVHFRGNVSGLVEVNAGIVSHSFSRVDLVGSSSDYVGGLVAFNGGLINQSYATGTVSTLLGSGGDTAAGGLVGYNEEDRIVDSYAVSKIRDGRKNCCDFGGLVGRNGEGATITNSYAAGPLNKNAQLVGGGFVGLDEAASGSIAKAYWDLDKGISDPSRGAGNIPNDPGITGLTDAELKSGLPFGFDPKVWGSNPKIDNGYPYLLENAPN